MKNKVFKISVILVMILTMTMTNFIFVGANLISYAVDNVATNYKNVEFQAYLKNDTTLSLQVSVKNEGYFNGDIALGEKSNFALKGSESKYVNKMENNTITLNKINSGETAEIDIEIEPVKKEFYDAGFISMENQLSLSGIYRDSSEKNKEVSATRIINYQIPENSTEENIENTSKIITNKIVTINNEEKRVIQIASNKGLKENNYPMAKIETNITLPSIDGKYPQVEVNTDFNNMTSCQWEQKDNEIAITLSNEPNDENKILWKESGAENIIITLIYDKEVDLKDSEIQMNDKITLYNNKELVKTNSLKVSDEEKDAIVQVFLENTETVMYKGKLYAKIDREYESKTVLKTNLANAVENIKVQETASKYQADNFEVGANVYYQSTTINKSQMLDILGENGYITIYNASSEAIATITKDTQDVNGDILINYDGDIAGITIETSSPQKYGTLEFRHKKIIKAINMEEIKKASNIVNSANGSYNQGEIAQNNANIELKETTTEATIQLNKTKLSTAITNENVEMKVTLNSANEKNDLYKNPKMQIELPEEVQEVTINSINKSYDANEFTITKYEVITTSTGRKAIQIELQGEQTNYIGGVAEGIQVVLNTNITLKKEMPSKETEINMTYTNEKGAQQNYQTKTPISILTREGTLVYSSLNYNNAEKTAIVTTDNETLTDKMDTQGEATKATVERTIINNNAQDMEKTVIVGTIDEKSTTAATISNVALSGANTKIYYSSQANVGADSDTWQEEVAEAKSYKIEVDQNAVEVGQVLKASYELNIPENIGFDKELYENTTVFYGYENQRLEKTASMYLATPVGDSQEAIDAYAKVSQVEGVGSVKSVAITGGKVINNETQVYEGQTIKYQVAITNTTGKDIENLKIDVKNKNAYLMDAVPYEMPDSFDEDKITTSYYLEEVEGLTNKTFAIEELKADETKIIEYQAVVNENVEETEAQISVANQQVVTLPNKVLEGSLKLELRHGVPVNYNIQPGTIVSSLLSVKNISDVTKKDIVVEFEIPEGLKLENVEEDENLEIIEHTENYLKCKITSLSQKATKDIIVFLALANNNPTEDMNVNMNYSAMLENNTYVSNEVTAINRVNENIQTNLAITQTANVESGSTIHTGDEITYTFTIENKKDEAVEIEEFKDSVPEAIEIEKAYYTLGNEEIAIEDIDQNIVKLSDIKLEANSKMIIGIMGKTNVDKSATLEINNYATVIAKEEQEIQSNEIRYKLYEEEKKDPVEEEPNESEINTISGTVWVDENKDGTKGMAEERIANVTVKLINMDNEKYIEAKTNETGDYKFENLETGKYMVAFEYDTTKYSATEYRKAGVSESVNSDIITNTITIEGAKKTVGLTDMIEINNSGASNIDAGLVENSVFDLSLNKYVSKVVVLNNAGTKTTEYKDTQLAKIELDAKQIANTTVVIEYTINVTNEGELAGYVSEIVDYKPNDLVFNSEMNKDWYTTTDGNLHTKVLADNRIEPGETKSVTVTLTKKMTESNTGMTNNTAEIAKSTNDALIADIDSVPGNQAKGEDDISTAEVIISVRTGLEIAIGTTVIIVVLGMITYIFFYIRKKRKEV